MSANQPDLGARDASLGDFLKNVGEMVAGTLSQQLHPVIEQYAKLFTNGMRTPVLKRPSDVGLKYQDVFFPSMDGTPLEAWFIPGESDRLLIVNHPMACNRYGFPGHLPPWNALFGGFEVDFLPELKHLHDAGYSILTYDTRNCGRSSEAHGGISGMGLLECRDVVGAIRYVGRQPHLASLTMGIYGRCMGGNSTIIAMAKWPDDFAKVRALVLLNVVSAKTFIERIAENLHLDPQKEVDKLSTRVWELTGFRLEEQTPLPHAHHVNIPTLMAQLRRDFLIHGEKDGKAIFNALGAPIKELMWIEESNQRFYAYNYFGQHPERLIQWFDQHMNERRIAQLDLAEMTISDRRIH